MATNNEPVSGPTNASALRKIRLFSQLPEAALSEVFLQLEPLPLKAGQTMDAHAWDKRVGFAWSGEYRILIIGPNGGTLSVRTIQEGGHLGEIPAFAEIPQLNYTLCVDHDGILLTMSRDAFRDLVKTTQELSISVMRSLAQASVLRADRLYEFAFLDIRTRLLAELLRLSHRAAMQDHVIKNAPTHEALAASVGSSRAIITRILGDLRDEGLVDARYKTIRYLDYEKLRRIVFDAVGTRPTYTFAFNETTH